MPNASLIRVTVIHYCAGTAADTVSLPAVREGCRRAHGGERDGVPGRGGPHAVRLCFRPHLAGDAQPCFS